MRTRVIAAAGLAVGAALSVTVVRPSFAEPTASTMQAAFRARVVGVYDGDTLLVRRFGQSRWQSIRLHGVDAPEYDPPNVQRYGYSAFAFVYNETMGQDVIVQPVTRDFYGRAVSEIVLSDNRLLQEKVLEAGEGWVYRYYIWEPRRTQWLQKEATARQQRAGLWADQNPTPPWVWRDFVY